MFILFLYSRSLKRHYSSSTITATESEHAEVTQEGELFKTSTKKYVVQFVF